ncbi:hypothetical protein LEP1GSC073_2990 [Leptospira noguchii str. Cascata]|uniref:hypothetical protein n=1 Tax=Leptospira noguchii TaxID=28182 RepID=UPI0002BF46B1|nr:hypothetical protein [Leptospira noguchii]EMI64756.1 hypothetical protein LEP1GSC072_0051 [Leptospira noguchii str. Bonito]EMS84582.1 hypothetical protein LEP1GSC073_2990 [Leptospira noguchii str. Cascata]
MYLNEMASEFSTLRWKGGEIFIREKEYNRQIYFRIGNLTQQITHFANWETIEQIFLSPDQKSLVVYHRAHKKNFYRLTLFYLEKLKQKIVRSIRPGMVCRDLFWYKNEILYETGTMGGGMIYKIYDENLKNLNSITGFDFKKILQSVTLFLM